MIQPKTRVTWCVVRSTADGDYVVQMKSRETGEWVDVVTLGVRANAMSALERWRSIYPGREFQLVKRTFTEEVIPG